MKITYCKTFETTRRKVTQAGVGVTADLPPEEALELIQLGYAESVDQVAVETATAELEAEIAESTTLFETAEQTESGEERFKDWTKAKMIARLAELGVSASESKSKAELLVLLDLNDN